MNCQRLLGTLVAVIAGACAIALWLHPDWRARFEIAKLEIRGGDAYVGGECPGYFSYDTYTNETHHLVMENIYGMACRRLETLSGGAGVQTSSWADRMGYPGVTTVLQLPRSYFSVTAFVGNDSNSVTVRSEFGLYNGPTGSGATPRVKLLNGWTLPKEFLASEWSTR